MPQVVNKINDEINANQEQKQHPYTSNPVSSSDPDSRETFITTTATSTSPPDVKVDQEEVITTTTLPLFVSDEVSLDVDVEEETATTTTTLKPEKPAEDIHETGIQTSTQLQGRDVLESISTTISSTSDGISSETMTSTLVSETDVSDSNVTLESTSSMATDAEPVTLKPTSPAIPQASQVNETLSDSSDNYFDTSPVSSTLSPSYSFPLPLPYRSELHTLSTRQTWNNETSGPVSQASSLVSHVEVEASDKQFGMPSLFSTTTTTTSTPPPPPSVPLPLQSFRPPPPPSPSNDHWSLWESMLVCRNIKSPRVLAETLKNMRGYHFNFIVLDSVKLPQPFPFSLFQKFSFDFLEILNISSIQFAENFNDRTRDYSFGRSSKSAPSASIASKIPL